MGFERDPPRRSDFQEGEDKICVLVSDFGSG